ncbi:MAG: VOC family protein [Chitinophagales bacterium]
MKNALNWFEIPAMDFDRAKKFYEHIFDYQMPVIVNEESFKMGLLPSDANGVGGAVVWHPAFYIPTSTNGLLVYLNANPDAAAVLERVEPAGGKIVIAKRQISLQFGYMAVFTDSEGNRLALHSND